MPSDVPSDVLSDVPSNLPSDVPSDLPAHLSSEPEPVEPEPMDAAPETASVADDAPGATGQDIAGRLEDVRSTLAALTEAVPDRADEVSIEAWLTSFRRLESVVAGLRSRLVGCVQVSRVHEEGGHAATTSYLRDQLGVSGREAKRQDVIARDLRQLPGTRAALAAGEIGPEQAQAIGEAARRGTLGDHRATEDLLLGPAADQGSDEFRRHIKLKEQEADSRSLERDEQRAYRRRRASLARRGDGMWDLHALLTDEDGETLATALDAFRTPDAPGTPIPERRSPQQRTADALVDVVGAALRGGAPTNGGVRPHLNLVIPVELLDQDSTEVATAGHGGILSSAAAARLLCDANVRRILTRGDSEVLDVGRTKREWSVAQRQALHVRDGGCRAPGCDRPAVWTDAHHIEWWSKDGVTSVDNGILLCRHHHRMVHEGGWTVSLDATTAVATFRSPTGRVVETRPHRWRSDGAAVGASADTDEAEPPESFDGPATGEQGTLDLCFSRPGPVVVSLDDIVRGDEVGGGEASANRADERRAPPLIADDGDGHSASDRSDGSLAREHRAAYRARSGTDPPRSRSGPAPPPMGRRGPRTTISPAPTVFAVWRPPSYGCVERTDRDAGRVRGVLSGHRPASGADGDRPARGGRSRSETRTAARGLSRRNANSRRGARRTRNEGHDVVDDRREP